MSTAVHVSPNEVENMPVTSKKPLQNQADNENEKYNKDTKNKIDNKKLEKNNDETMEDFLKQARICFEEHFKFNNSECQIPMELIQFLLTKKYTLRIFFFFFFYVFVCVMS